MVPCVLQGSIRACVCNVPTTGLLEYLYLGCLVGDDLCSFSEKWKLNAGGNGEGYAWTGYRTKPELENLSSGCVRASGFQGDSGAETAGGWGGGGEQPTCCNEEEEL